jgi:phosphopantothenoylcysteine decarboxylase/phosphopantothenate--cysteine ligase
MPNILITAGPTHEPIDAVRFIGNRSSGRVGAALADEAARRGWGVTLLLGPMARKPESSAVRIRRYNSTADLQALLHDHLPDADLLVMAAAVADFRPVLPEGAPLGKIRRASGPLAIQLEPTPDLLAGCAERRRSDQILVGFALEPRNRLTDSARAKLERKRIDYIVANPLETMDADTIAATLFKRGGEAVASTDGAITKPEFARWLLDQLQPVLDEIRRRQPHRAQP